MYSVRTVALASLTALAVLATSSACQLAGSSGDTSDIVIAADLELSGAQAPIGTAYDRALRLKVEQINLRGVLGKRKVRLEVKDNHSDPTLSLTNVARFASNTEIKAIITGACSSCAIGSAKTLNEKQKPAIALAPALEVATPVADRRYLFKLGPNPIDGAAALAAEIKRSGLKTVGLLATDDEYGRDGQFALPRELSKAGVQITGQGVFKPTDTDLSQPMQKALAEQPDALVFWTYPNQAGIAAVAARSAGFTGKLYLDGAAAGDLFLTGPAALATEQATMISTQTMVIDDVIATTPAKAARRQWFRDYASRYGGYYGYASFAADALQLIVNAIEAVGGTNSDRLRDVLENARLDGLSGPIRITPDNHSGLMPQALAVLVARGGRWRLVS